MYATLKELLKEELFSDGDWVESKDQDPNGEVRLIQLADIGVNKFLDKSKRFMTEETSKSLKCTLLNENDVLVSRMPDPIGKSCVFPAKKQQCATVVDVSILRPNSEQLNPFFLSYQLNSPLVRNQIEKYVTGTTRKRISRKNLGKIKIYFPSLEDQKRIVKILDQADALRQKRKQAIELLDEYVKSVFLEMFGEQKNAYVEELKNVSQSMKTGPFGSALKHGEFVSAGIPVLGIDNVVDNEFKWKKRRFITEEKYKTLERYTVKPFDVLITIMGTVGRSVVVPENIGTAINTKHLACIRLNHSILNPFFLSYALIHDPLILQQLTGNKRGAIMDGLNIGILKKLKISIPPKESQEKFVSFLQHSQGLKQKMLQQSQELETQFQALMQKAFKGEL